MTHEEAEDVKRHFDVVAEGFREQADDIKRHFNVVAEELRSEIRLVAEGHATLDRRIDELRQEVHEYRNEARGQLQSVAGSLRNDMAADTLGQTWWISGQTWRIFEQT